VLYADLGSTIGYGLVATVWESGLITGERRQIEPGAQVIVTDGEDAYWATVDHLDLLGPIFRIHWDQPVEVPPGI
jgi:hypothetical protein